LISKPVPSGNSLTTRRRSWIILRNGVPMFNGQNGFKYEMWSIRIEVFLQEHGHYIWLSVVTEYDSSKRAKTAAKKELRKNKKIAMDFIWEGLPNLVREKVG
jgi:hypothetical protein